MSDHDEVERASDHEALGLTRRDLLRLGILTAAAAQGPLAFAPWGAAQTPMKLGANLIGKLEGPEVITDPARFPKTFKEAPPLAELVKAGKLPPVQQRIGQDPLVIKPLREIGKYGGTWRRGFTGPFDTSNGHRVAQNDKLLYYDYTGTKLVPNIARAWEVSADGKVTTLLLRRGMRWSDGQPFTADDFIFWYQDVYLNKDLVPTPLSVMTVGGKPDRHGEGGRQHRPLRLARAVLRASHRARLRVGHRASRAVRTLRAGRLRPRPLHQAVPPEVHVPGRAQQEGDGGGCRQLGHAVQEPQRRLPERRSPGGDAVEDHVAHHQPQLGAGAQSLQRLGGHRRQSAPLHRPDPHDAGREPRGHQPPRHRGRVRLPGPAHRHQQAPRAPGESAEGRLPRLPRPLRSGGRRGPLLQSVVREGRGGGEVAEHARVRIALSHAIDRAQINETFVLGLGQTGSGAPGERTLYFPGPEYKTLHATLDVKKANETLDKLGLTKKDAEGYRLRLDGGGRLRLALTTYVGFLPFSQIAEMVVEHWKKIGIRGEVQEMERGAATARMQSNEHQIYFETQWGADNIYGHTPWIFPAEIGIPLGPLYGVWYSSAGAKGKTPPARMRELMDKYRKSLSVKDTERVNMAKDVWKIALDELWMIPVVSNSPASQGVRVIKTNMGNIPERLWNSAVSDNPHIAHTETWYFKS
jgi:ABC-type transport system substrate-binding protein